MNSARKIAILESIKPYESRLPIHPQHLASIQPSLNQLVFQNNYANQLGQYSSLIEKTGFSFASRNELLSTSDVIFLLKPLVDDLEKMKRGAILIGWCHAIQRIDIAKTAVERGLTLIAMEAMYRGNQEEHLFHKNNFSAGNLGVEHALSFTPFDYSLTSPIAVISYGTASQGAVTKLLEKGFSDITVFSRRPSHLIQKKFSTVSYETFEIRNQTLFCKDGKPLKDNLLSADIIVNGVVQNVLAPYQFLTQDDLKAARNKLIIDLSCDDRMGFDFAHATSMDKPVLKIEENYYYAVDHIPTLDWKNVSLEISCEIVPIVNYFLTDSHDQAMMSMLEKATEIYNGKVLNNVISQYQEKINVTETVE